MWCGENIRWCGVVNWGWNVGGKLVSWRDEKDHDSCCMVGLVVVESDGELCI